MQFLKLRRGQPFSFNGLLFQPSDPASLTQAVLALEDQELRQRLSQNAYAEGQQFGWDGQSRQLFNFYQDVIASHHTIR